MFRGGRGWIVAVVVWALVKVVRTMNGNDSPRSCRGQAFGQPGYTLSQYLAAGIRKVKLYSAVFFFFKLALTSRSPSIFLV